MRALGPFVTKNMALRLATITGAKDDASVILEDHIGVLGLLAGHHLTAISDDVKKMQ